MTDQHDPAPPTGRRRRQDPPRRGVSPWALSGLLAVPALVVVAVAVSCSGDDPAVTPAGAPVVPRTSAAAVSTSSAPLASPSAPPVADLPEGAFAGDPPEGEGPYVVGQDMPAGRYLTAGPRVVGEPGTWERHRLRSRSSASGEAPELEVIATGTVEGPEVIVVKAGDRLSVRGLKPLHRVG